MTFSNKLYCIVLYFGDRLLVFNEHFLFFTFTFSCYVEFSDLLSWIFWSNVVLGNRDAPLVESVLVPLVATHEHVLG